MYHDVNEAVIAPSLVSQRVGCMCMPLLPQCLCMSDLSLDDIAHDDLMTR